ncbi:hypothetical protein CTI12_AA199390 [Artemisia annua]|uniref:Uncharacterized protein n=1 Tax=Artemisia annua TaxID=35608 RepID=A0A2U1P3B0_ARTAN|nr:hypothetical protein CTI12_AA199390 [Artemisia annua]
MESAYWTWVRQKREGLKSNDLDELCRELQTALGTAKCQEEACDGIGSGCGAKVEHSFDRSPLLPHYRAKVGGKRVVLPLLGKERVHMIVVMVLLDDQE